MFRPFVFFCLSFASADECVADGLALLQQAAKRTRNEQLTASGKCFDVKGWYDEFMAGGQESHWSKFSQGSQDSVLASLFSESHLGSTNRFFVEFGFNSDGWNKTSTGPNTKNLKQSGWHGLLLDGSHENLADNLHKEFVSRENIANLFDKYAVPKDPDYVSIDIDSCDLWVFVGLVRKNRHRPRVLTVEYNSFWHFEDSRTNVCKTKTGEQYVWRGDNLHGASLAAISKAAHQNGYTVVYVERWLDAFLVRSDLVCPGSELPLKTFARHTGISTGKQEANQTMIEKWTQIY